MEIHQIQVQYSADEDRIILRLSTRKEQLFQFLITRRFIKSFWPALLKMMSTSISMTHYAAEAKQAVIDFEQEKVMATAKTEQPFSTHIKEYPLGKEPLLLSAVTHKKAKDGTPILGIHDSRGVGIELNSGHSLIHYLYNALQTINSETDWNLKLQRINPGNDDQATLNKFH